MQEQEFELSIGDSIEIGPYTVTVVDIEGVEVCFQIEEEDEFQQVSLGDCSENVTHT